MILKLEIGSVPFPSYWLPGSVLKISGLPYVRQRFPEPRHALAVDAVPLRAQLQRHPPRSIKGDAVNNDERLSSDQAIDLAA